MLKHDPPSLSKVRIEGDGTYPTTKISVDGQPVYPSAVTYRLDVGSAPRVTLEIPSLAEFPGEFSAVVDPPPVVLAAYEIVRKYRIREPLPAAARFIGGTCADCRYCYQPEWECHRYNEPGFKVYPIDECGGGAAIGVAESFGCMQWEPKP